VMLCWLGDVIGIEKIGHWGRRMTHPTCTS
jgi:hypothetical protein